MPIIRIVKKGNFVCVRCITLLENERKINYLVSCRSEPLIILCKGRTGTVVKTQLNKTPLHAEVYTKINRNHNPQPQPRPSPLQVFLYCKSSG